MSSPCILVRAPLHRDWILMGQVYSLNRLLLSLLFSLPSYPLSVCVYCFRMIRRPDGAQRDGTLPPSLCRCRFPCRSDHDRHLSLSPLRFRNLSPSISSFLSLCCVLNELVLIGPLIGWVSFRSLPCGAARCFACSPLMPMVCVWECACVSSSVRASKHLNLCACFVSCFIEPRDKL